MLIRNKKGQFVKGGASYWLGKINDFRLSKENHWNWSGDNCSYNSLHKRVRKELGEPLECIYCGERKKRLEWANFNGEKLYSKISWISLCVRCHRIFDRHPYMKNCSYKLAI